MCNFESYITGKPIQWPSLYCKSIENRTEIFQNREKNYQHVGKCIACDFGGIAASHRVAGPIPSIEGT